MGYGTGYGTAPLEGIIIEERPYGGPTMQGTTFTENIWRDTPGAFPVYTSLIQDSVDLTVDLAEKAYAEFLAGFKVRIRAGQTGAGTITSGLPSSTLRMPEIHHGSLFALTL